MIIVYSCHYYITTVVSVLLHLKFSLLTFVGQIHADSHVIIVRS